MKVSNRTQEFRTLLRTSFLIVLSTLGMAVLASCTTTYTARSRPLPAPEPEVVYVVEHEPYPDAFPELEKFGRWILVDDVGWAWSPDVQESWRPYYHGSWALANGDWTWVSYEPYGWAVYHYGNWSLDPYWGWLWFPDYEWQPHRVTWLVYQDYVAWAPTPYHGYVVGDPWTPEYSRAWNVCHVSNFNNPYVGDYHVVGFGPRHRRVQHYVVWQAPQPTYIYERCGVRVVPVHISMRQVPAHREGIKRIYWSPQDELRLKKQRTRTYKELYDPQGRPTPMTRPDEQGIPDVDRRVGNDRPTPMTQPGVPDIDRRTGNDRPTPMTRPDNPKTGEGGPIIITSSDDPPGTKPTKPTRQHPGKDKKGDWRRPADTKPNLQDPGTRDSKGNWKRPEDTRPNRQEPNKKDLKNDSKPIRQEPDKKADDKKDGDKKNAKKDDKDKDAKSEDKSEDKVKKDDKKKADDKSKKKDEKKDNDESDDDDKDKDKKDSNGKKKDGEDKE